MSQSGSNLRRSVLSFDAVPSEARSFQGQRAGIVSRTAANVVDFLVLVGALVCGYATWSAVRFLINPTRFTFPAPPFLALLLCGAGFLLVYFTSAWATTGRTYGDHLLGLRVVNFRGERMRWTGAAARAAFCVVVPIGLYWAVVSPSNRSLQDTVLRTSVLYDWTAGRRMVAPVVPGDPESGEVRVDEGADRMADTGIDPVKPGPGLKRHSGLVWTLIVLGAVIALVASLTVWVKRQALDEDAWAQVSSNLLQDDQVREALSVYIVDQLYTHGDVSGRLQQRLPTDLAGLAEPLAGALRAPAVNGVNRLLDQPRVQELWVKVNRIAHQRLVAVLSGQPRSNVSTANGTVVLDLRSFVVEVGGQLGIGERLDQTLPPDVGQVTVLKSDQLKTAQKAVKAIKALSILFGIATVLLWGVALWLAVGWRRVALRGVGASLLVVGLLLLVIRQVAGNYVVDSLTSGVGVRGAAQSTWLIATTLLSAIGWALILYGVCFVAGAWLAGPTRLAVDARIRIAPTVVQRPGLAWAGVGSVFLLLVWWGPTHALHTVLGVIVLGALVAVGFEVLRRIVVTEQAAQPPDVASTTPSRPSPMSALARARARADE